MRTVQPTVGIIDIDLTTFCLKTVFPEISAGLKLLYTKHWTNSKQSPKGDNNSSLIVPAKINLRTVCEENRGKEGAGEGAQFHSPISDI